MDKFLLIQCYAPAALIKYLKIQSQGYSPGSCRYVLANSCSSFSTWSLSFLIRPSVSSVGLYWDLIQAISLAARRKDCGSSWKGNHLFCGAMPHWHLPTWEKYKLLLGKGGLPLQFQGISEFREIYRANLSEVSMQMSPAYFSGPRFFVFVFVFPARALTLAWLICLGWAFNHLEVLPIKARICSSDVSALLLKEKRASLEAINEILWLLYLAINCLPTALNSIIPL